MLHADRRLDQMAVLGLARGVAEDLGVAAQRFSHGAVAPVLGRWAEAQVPVHLLLHRRRQGSIRGDQPEQYEQVEAREVVGEGVWGVLGLRASLVH